MLKSSRKIDKVKLAGEHFCEIKVNNGWLMNLSQFGLLEKRKFRVSGLIKKDETNDYLASNAILYKKRHNNLFKQMFAYF